MSRTYQRTRKGGINVDPDAYDTYRNGVAYRILRKYQDRLSYYEVWQLAAFPAFILWIFRKPISFFKRRKADRMLRSRLKKSNSNSRSAK